MSEESARRMLGPSGIQGRLSNWLRGDLKAVASAFIPFRLYRVAVDDRGARTSRYYAIDAACGLLDPYEFQAIPELDEVITRNTIAVNVTEAVTRERAIEKMRRKLYTTGFFRLRNPAISAELVRDEFYMPYWAGFFGEERNMNMVAIDAIRHTMEGAKVRRVIQDWLMHHPAEK